MAPRWTYWPNSLIRIVSLFDISHIMRTWARVQRPQLVQRKESIVARADGERDPHLSAHKTKLHSVRELVHYGLAMSLSPIQHIVSGAPLPERVPAHRPAVHKDTMFALLGTMEPGGPSIDVSRSKRSVQGYVYRFRVDIAPESQYVIRGIREGWTRIWRVK